MPNSVIKQVANHFAIPEQHGPPPLEEQFPGVSIPEYREALILMHDEFLQIKRNWEVENDLTYCEFEYHERMHSLGQIREVTLIRIAMVAPELFNNVEHSLQGFQEVLNNLSESDLKAIEELCESQWMHMHLIRCLNSMGKTINIVDGTKEIPLRASLADPIEDLPDFLQTVVSEGRDRYKKEANTLKNDATFKARGFALRYAAERLGTFKEQLNRLINDENCKNNPNL